MKSAVLNKKFHVYLFKELLLFFILALSVFTFILVVSRLGKMADLIINRGVDLKDILLLVAYSCPPMLTFTLPMSFLLASVVALGRLSSENEILALKASGVNLRSLFVPVSALGIAVLIAGFLNNSLLLSKSTEAVREIFINIAKKGFSIQEGIFNEFPGVVIYVDKVDSTHKSMSGIIISDDRDESCRQTFTAEKGSVNLDLKTFDLSFVLRNGSLQRWQRQAGTYQSLAFQNYAFYVNLSSLLPNRELKKRPWEMDIQELRKAFLAAKSGNRYDFALEIYNKFSVPLSVVAFMLLTVPLGVRRRAEGKFSGVVYSLLIFISYYILSAISENVGRIYEAWPFFVSFAPNIIFSITGLYLVTGLNSETRGGIFLRWRRRWGS
jgi:lipopolysaccharide export system permease protein